MWHVARGTWYVARGTRHVARGTSHVARRTWHAARRTWHAARRTWHAARRTWHVLTTCRPASYTPAHADSDYDGHVHRAIVPDSHSGRGRGHHQRSVATPFPELSHTWPALQF